ncbi:RNA polymerase sigma factor [Leucothrix arctica]|uniref:RNA polymerase sigma factor n=1 Tax=Leucothrix arctica TaxID=1481894 RepID=A0A317C455_9GAMM|nr:sigma-70 family RNA polymerase sigma factor [Leucothrix arctica]PWQ93087.1 hypothetical protein DKT75_20570 [Leucothrix arctica]
MNTQQIQGFQQGDKDAFAALVSRFQTPLFAYLGRMGLPAAMTEEVAQETFIRAWQSREQFDPTRSSISTWLFTIARRLAINELSRASYRYEQTSDNNESTYTDDTSISSEQTLQLAEQQKLLQQAIQTLDANDRSLLALAYLKDLELSIIAEIEGIPVGTVKSRLHRIRQQLKRTLNGDDFHD